MDEQRYYIREFAKIFGLTADTIRYYESTGLLDTKREEFNKYRYYTANDASRIMYIRLLRSLKFSVKQIKEEAARIDHPLFSSQLVKQRDAIDTEIQFLTMLRDKINYYMALSQRIISGRDLYGLVSGPHSYGFVMQMECENLVDLDLRTDGLLLELYNHLPLSFPCIIFSFPEEEDLPQYCSGIGISEEYAKYIGIWEHIKEKYVWEQCYNLLIEMPIAAENAWVKIRKQIEMYLGEDKIQTGQHIFCEILPMSPKDKTSWLNCYFPVRKEAL